MVFSSDVNDEQLFIPHCSFDDNVIIVMKLALTLTCLGRAGRAVEDADDAHLMRARRSDRRRLFLSRRSSVSDQMGPPAEMLEMLGVEPATA